MNDTWRELTKIPQMTLKNEDGWEYRCTGYSDNVCVEYWEPVGDDNKMTKRSGFSVPSFCAEKLFSELADMAKQIKDFE
jgi:hypothetical protein